MAFPEDLSNVTTFKIHPAIGCARLANNPDEYEFFESEENREEARYMTEQAGAMTMMRQAVQFQIFAYDDARNLLGELDEATMDQLGIVAIWRARIANRKLHNYSKRKPGHPVIPEIAASGEVSGDDTVVLEGANPFDASKKITLGMLSGRGRFSPPMGGVHRRSPGAEIPLWPADQGFDLDVTDTTSDGSIEVELSNAGDIPVIPAWVVVAPQQHSPDVNPGHPDLEGETNLDWTSETRRALGITGSPPDHAASQIDEMMVATLNGEYNPGMEVSFQQSRIELQVNAAFYPRDKGSIGPNEIRIQPVGAGGAPGTLPGQLTSGLCSTWQGDLSACLDYWTAQYPNEVVRESDGAEVFLARKDYEVNERMFDAEELLENADHMGVARNTTGDVNLLAETERKP